MLVDPDRVKAHNLDRLLYAGETDVGEYKVDLAVRNLQRGATAERFHVEAHARPIQHETAYRAMLDCDLVFSLWTSWGEAIRARCWPLANMFRFDDARA